MEASPGPHSATRANRRILVADDNRDTADSLAMILRSWGYEPLVAYDGLTALRIGQKEQPAAAVLDLGLPGMDGYQLAQNLRRESGLETIPLIAVTGYTWKAAHIRSEEYGFDHHFVKPLDLEQLRQILTDSVAAPPG
jgi:CheY-like chemotaxis protein